MRREVAGRLDYHGAEMTALDLSELPAILDDFRAEGVQAGHPVAAAQDVEGLLAHAGHDPHADGDVGRVGQLHADVGDG